MIPGFQSAIVGMRTGEKKAFEVPCAEAYGPTLSEAVFKVPKEAFSGDMSLVIGETVLGRNPQGQSMQAVIRGVEDDGVLLDHNHPLAGKDLNFEVELMEVSRVKE